MKYSIALGLILMAATFAQDGSYRLFGKFDGKATLTRIFVKDTPVGIRLERTTSRDVEGAETTTIYAKSATTNQDGEVEVEFVRSSGTVGALVGEPVVLSAIYTFNDDGSVTEVWQDGEEEGESKGFREGPPLVLERESRLEDLFGDALKRYEASGVVVVDQRVFVVCDNKHAVLSIPADLNSSDAKVHKLKGKGGSDFEGITVDRRRGRFYAVQEGVKRKGEDTPRLWELDDELDLDDKHWLDLKLDGVRKGTEGLTHVHRDGEDYLLALMEGNSGRDKRAGRERGKGRIEIFRRSKKKYRPIGRIELPERAFFADYSGIDVRGDRVVVISQASAQLWVGNLHPDTFEFQDEGSSYRFPATGSSTTYPVMEGVAWLDADRVVVVSDRPNAPLEAEDHAQQSIHVFRIPAID